MGVDAVERVVRAVAVSPLPEAPRGVRGVINLQGKIVPVFDIWARCGAPERDLRESDHLIVAHTHWRMVALLVDSVVGVVPRVEARITPAAEILPDLQSLIGLFGSISGDKPGHDDSIVILATFVYETSGLIG